MIPPELRERLEQVFDPQQAAVLAQVVAGLSTATAPASEVTALRGVVQELAQAQLRTEHRLATLTERVSALAERVDALAEAQRRTELRLEMLVLSVDKLAQAQEGAATRLGSLDGRVWELTYRDKAGASFGPLVRRMRLVTPQMLDDLVEGHVTPEEFDEVLHLDMVVAGRPRRVPFDGEVWLAVEISSTIDPHDISRARRRASILRRAGVAAVPVVAGERLTAEAGELAEDERVLVMVGGHANNWDKALAGAADAGLPGDAGR